MDLRRLCTITKPTPIFYPITRPLTCVTSTSSASHNNQNQPQPQPPLQPLELESDPPKPPNQSLFNWVSSILSNPSLDSSKCKSLIPHLSPHHFDTILFSVALVNSNAKPNPKTTLNFFYFASQSFNFRFTLRSYCILIRLLILSNLVSPARLLLIRLIDGKMPVLSYANTKNLLHIEIATMMADFNSTTPPERALGVQVSDLLVHVYCTQFKNLDFGVDVFCLLARKGMFPSIKTCNFLLSSLVKANELSKSYEVFEMTCQGVSPDVYLFSTAINAFCKGGKVEDGIGLFLKMEEVGIVPNVVTYNSIIHGLCKNGRLDEAFHFKERMLRNKVKPSLITYSVLINGFVRLEKFDEANCVLKEMLDKGFVPNEIVYNTLIDGYCKTGNISEALKIRGDMVFKGIMPNSVTLNSLTQGFCKSNEIERAEHILGEMLLRGLNVSQVTYTAVIKGLCMKSRLESALQFTGEMLTRNLRPSDVLLTTLVVELSLNNCKSRLIMKSQESLVTFSLRFKYDRGTSAAASYALRNIAVGYLYECLPLSWTRLIISRRNNIFCFTLKEVILRQSDKAEYQDSGFWGKLHLLNLKNLLLHLRG
ncbi:hypothetical protein CMV_024843 [Castanea mollissima]|uniref:Pentatricopeptide repeat-containing protein n=1 Tax=Castanea mollissima TaxID=60419 RepID=A0A8J4QQV1_9ROSI|nr:hypothetical protein CMV_024843 [Castanea mollissima]